MSSAGGTGFAAPGGRLPVVLAGGADGDHVAERDIKRPAPTPNSAARANPVSFSSTPIVVTRTKLRPRSQRSRSTTSLGQGGRTASGRGAAISIVTDIGACRTSLRRRQDRDDWR